MILLGPIADVLGTPVDEAGVVDFESAPLLLELDDGYAAESAPGVGMLRC